MCSESPSLTPCRNLRHRAGKRTAPNACTIKSAGSTAIASPLCWSRKLGRRCCRGLLREQARRSLPALAMRWGGEAGSGRKWFSELVLFPPHGAATVQPANSPHGRLGGGKRLQRLGRRCGGISWPVRGLMADWTAQQRPLYRSSSLQLIQEAWWWGLPNSVLACPQLGRCGSGPPVRVCCLAVRTAHQLNPGSSTSGP